MTRLVLFHGVVVFVYHSVGIVAIKLAAFVVLELLRVAPRVLKSSLHGGTERTVRIHAEFEAIALVHSTELPVAATWWARRCFKPRKWLLTHL